MSASTPPLRDGLRAAVVGSTEPDRTAGWLTHLGFTDRREIELTAAAGEALYQDAAATQVVELWAPDSVRGSVRIVQAASDAASGTEHWQRGPLGFLVYTRDIHDSLAITRGDGAVPSEIASYMAGPKLMQEARTVYPDGSVVVFVQVEDRRPSLLDDHAGRQHSEVHSITFVVDALDEDLARWEVAGLTTTVDLTIANPDITAFLSLPRREAPIRIAMLSPGDEAPPRVELLAYPQDAGPPAPAVNSPVTVGLRAATAHVDDLDDVALPDGAILGPIVDSGTSHHPRCALLDLGGGTRVELWERG